MKLIKCFFASLLALSLSCATIFTGTSDSVTFNTDPAGAEILIDGIPMGKTPATISVSRAGLAGKTVTLKLAGHQERSFVMQKSFNMVSIVSIVVGILPVVVDVATGALMEADPINYNVNLEKRAEIQDALKVNRVVFTEELSKDKNNNPVIDGHANEKVAVVDTASQQIIVLE